MALTNPQSADHIAAAAGTFEPQRQNNFQIEIPLSGSDKDYISMSLQAVPLPNESNEEVEIKFQNESRYVAGKYKVDASQLSIRDYVDQDTRGAIMRWRKQVFDPQTGRVGLAADYKKTAHIVLHGPDGSTERVCKLIGCWPQAINGGTLNMDSAEQVMMEVVLRYDLVDWSQSLVGA